MGDVLEYIVDGASGLAPGGTDGSAMVVGVSSLGTVGKGYLLGPSSDIEGTLGAGPLVDRLKDLFATAGQDAVVVAVPVSGSSGGYISEAVHAGTGPDGAVSGTPAGNADVVVEIVAGGALGTATYQLSTDGGETFGEATATPANGQITIGASGATLTLEAGTHVAGDTYSFVVRMAIGPVTQTGTGPEISVAGTPLCAAQVGLGICKAGGRNAGTYQLTVDGDNWGVEKTIPVDGVIAVGSTGVTITIPAQDMVAGDLYEFDVLAPVPSITGVISAIESPLELYDVEFVYVVGPSDAVDWAAMGVKADALWNAHRPTFFVGEARLPYDGEDLDDWVAYLVNEKNQYSHRFVTVCAAYGEVMDTSGKMLLRNWGGLLAGRLLSIPVMRAIGRVKDGGISQGSLPEDLTTAMQKVLESEGFVTAKHYAGLTSAYWGDGRTLADATSDYQYIHVVRTVFKAVRLARIAALGSIYDELGDPKAEAGASGLNTLKANIENALDTMVKAVPSEMAGRVVAIPDGQDFVNNGVATELTFIGIPVIGSITLYSKYVYAGSSADPRLAS